MNANKEKLQVLVSTENLKDDEQVNKLLNKMKIQTDYRIINQVEKDVKIANPKVITVRQKGLSASRNLAIKNATADIVLLADNDMIYSDGYSQVIKNAYMKNPNVDMICFWVKSRNRKRKIKRMLSGKVGYVKAMRVNSVQISMRTDSIKEIKFDERFGAGSIYDRGEEAIFLCDCLRKGLKIKYINKKIAEVEQKESSWRKGYSKEHFYIQGKVFKRMYPKMYKLIILQFAIRKYFQYRKKVSLKDALQEMLKV